MKDKLRKFRVYTFFVVLSFIVGLFCSSSIMAEVSIPYVLGSNMVVQREIGTNIWGWAKPGEKVSVTFREVTVKTKADKSGNWKVKIPTGAAGGPFQLTIEGTNKITLGNILVGDVWVCSGQSNMEFQLERAQNGKEEARKATYPNIRLFQVEKNASLVPVNNTAKTQWVECNPLTALNFSAVGYFFGKKIHLETGIPIGLISSNWGGTIVETWTSEEAVNKDNELAKWLSEKKNIDMEALAKEQERVYTNYRKELEKVQKSDWNHEYIHPDYDDSKWVSFDQPALWETHPGYEKFDGVMWFRKQVIIPSGFNLSSAKISLAKIDDSDITWINGKRVGETFNKYNLPRLYEIPSGVLTFGKNQLVVRVEDYTGGGGFYGLASEMYLTDGAITIDLSGSWKMTPDPLKVPSNPENPNQTTIQPNQFPTLLYNGMINPIINYAIKGVIWYQGESNADAIGQALKYEGYLKNMVSDWRNHWGIGDFSFYEVQLANYKQESQKPQFEVWPFLREAQANVAQMPHAGMACIIDIGNADDIHPTDKIDVGNRLARVSLKNDYGKNIIANGPQVDNVTIDINKAVVTFKEAGTGLIVKNKYGYINGFAVAGADKEFHYAKASLKSNNSVEITCEIVGKIEAVRFLWADNPGEINLYNSEGLPAEPFRTDKW